MFIFIAFYVHTEYAPSRTKLIIIRETVAVDNNWARADEKIKWRKRI